ncbi:MAG: tail fiber domain-containing protein, partial [Acidobacteria bacterium]|nr:tail fiber domain-containing protein [Acidobacteriota bacterium]
LLDKLVKLQPVNFFWRSSEFPQRSFGDRQSYGLIAQEVEAVLPELVSTDAEGFKAVNYSKLPLLLLQGIKDQQQLSQQLKQENAELKQQLAEQQLRFRRQESEFRELKRLVCLSAPQADACQPPK